MSNSTNERRKSPVFVTLSNGDVYTFDDPQQAIDFFGQMILDDPENYSALYALSDVYAQACLENAIELSWQKETDEIIYSSISSAYEKSPVETYPALQNLAFDGTERLLDKMLNKLLTPHIMGLANLFMERAKNEFDFAKRSVLYTKAEKSYHVCAEKIEKDTIGKIADELSGASKSERQKETNLRLKDNKEYQQALKGESDAALENHHTRAAYNAAKKMPKPEKEEQKKKIKKSYDKQARKIKTEQEMRPTDPEEQKKKEQEKEKTRQARIARRAARKAAKANGNFENAAPADAAQKEQDNRAKPQDKVRTDDKSLEEQLSRDAADHMAKKTAELQEKQVQAKEFELNSLKRIGEERAKNIENFAVGLSKAANAASISSQKIEQSAELLVTSGASFKSAASSVATSKTAVNNTSGISAAQSGVLSRIAAGREVELRDKENHIKSRTSRDIQDAELKVLITYKDLAKECNVPLPRLSKTHAQEKDKQLQKQSNDRS